MAQVVRITGPKSAGTLTGIPRVFNTLAAPSPDPGTVTFTETAVLGIFDSSDLGGVAAGWYQFVDSFDAAWWALVAASGTFNAQKGPPDAVVGTVTTVTTVTGLAAGAITAASIAADAITAAKIADGAIDAATFAAGAINAAAIAADAITDAKVASDVTIASVTGAVGSVTSGVTLADAVTHGGSTAKLRLGSTTSTPAILVTNTDTGNNSHAAYLQAGIGGAGGLGLLIDGGGLATSLFAPGADGFGAPVLTTLKADTDDIQSRLPSALVGGRMDSSTGAMSANTLTASALATDAVAEIQSGLATSASVATVQADTDDIQTRLPAALVGGKMDSTATVTGDVTLATSQPNYAPSKAGDAMALTTGERTTLAAVIWNALTSGMTTVGSIGKKLADWVIGSPMQAGSTVVLTDASLTTAKLGTFVLAKTTNITGLNDLSAAQVNTEADAALVDIHLDHLLAVDYDPAAKPGVATALFNELIGNDGGVSQYTANALELGPTGGTAPTTAQIATAIWTDLLASTDFSTALSIGKLLKDNIDATISSRASQASVDDLPTNAELTASLATADDATLAAIAALNNLSAAQVATALATYDAPTFAEMVAAFTEIKGAGWLAGTDTLELIRDAITAAGTSLTAAQIRAAIGMATANLDTQLDALPTAAENATTTAAAITTDHGAGSYIRNTEPDNATIGTTGTAVAALTTAVADVPTAIENADAVLLRDWTAIVATIPSRCLLQASRALRNRMSTITNPGFVTFYKEDDATEAFSKAVITDSAAEPITEA